MKQWIEMHLTEGETERKRPQRTTHVLVLIWQLLLAQRDTLLVPKTHLMHIHAHTKRPGLSAFIYCPNFDLCTLPSTAWGLWEACHGGCSFNQIHFVVQHWRMRL